MDDSLLIAALLLEIGGMSGITGKRKILSYKVFIPKDTLFVFIYCLK